MGTEKRKYLRFECTLPAKVTRVEEQNGLEEKAQVDDFSREGLRMVMNVEFNFAPGSVLELQCSLPGKQATAWVSAEVIWSRNEAGKCELGLQIKDMAPEARSEILDSCYEQWQKKKSTLKD
jgi:c-di-GMP-binding flagellar brake protein YcgR